MDARSKRLNLSAGIASVTVALALIGLKLWALVATGALSVAASLADNALDLMMSLTALAAIAYAARPADDDHAYGHSSAEDLAALMQAAVVLVSAAAVGGLAVKRLAMAEPPAIAAEGVGIGVMLASVGLTAALVAWQRHVARATGNRVVAADSLHYLSDLLPTLGVLAALVASAWWGQTRVDAWVALAAAAWLARTGLGIGRGAWDALMDHAAPEAVLETVRQVAGNWPGVLGYHDLKTRTAGSRVFVALHIEVDGRLTLNEAHAIADGLEHAIEAAVKGAEVIIHLDPVGEGSGRVARGAPQGRSR